MLYPGQTVPSLKMVTPVTGADLGGGMGGMHPPTNLKVTISAEKSASISKN